MWDGAERRQDIDRRIHERRWHDQIAELSADQRILLDLMPKLLMLPEGLLPYHLIDHLLGVTYEVCKACAAGNHGQCPDVQRAAVPMDERAPGAYASCTCQHRGSGYGPGETPPADE